MPRNRLFNQYQMSFKLFKLISTEIQMNFNSDYRGTEPTYEVERCF